MSLSDNEILEFGKLNEMNLIKNYKICTLRKKIQESKF